jgi:hypothetical protein
MQVLPSSTSAVASSLYQSLAKVSSGEGLMTLWRGVNSVILGAGPAHAVYFGTYEIVKELMGGNREGHQFVATGQSNHSTIRSFSFGHLGEGRLVSLLGVDEWGEGGIAIAEREGS